MDERLGDGLSEDIGLLGVRALLWRTWLAGDVRLADCKTEKIRVKIFLNCNSIKTLPWIGDDCDWNSKSSGCTDGPMMIVWGWAGSAEGPSTNCTFRVD